MRRMMTGRRRVLLTAGVICIFILGLAATAGAAAGTKNLSAIFRNIQIHLNGQVLQAEEEPFIVNGRTYVPLRVISEGLGMVVNWDSKLNLVSITGSAAGEEIDKLRNENAQLRQQVAELQEKLDEEQASKPNLNTLEQKLAEKYSTLITVKFDEIKASGNEKKITVNAIIDLEEYADEWAAIRDGQIRDWADKICQEIQLYYTQDTDIVGNVQVDDSDVTLVEFSKSGKQIIRVSFRDQDYRGGNIAKINKVKDELKGKAYKIEGIEFRLDRPHYRVRVDEIDACLRAESEGAKKTWDRLATADVEDAMVDICEELVDSFAFADYMDPDIVNLEVLDADGSLLGKFKYDVDDEDLDWLI